MKESDVSEWLMIILGNRKVDIHCDELGVLFDGSQK